MPPSLEVASKRDMANCKRQPCFFVGSWAGRRQLYSSSTGLLVRLRALPGNSATVNNRSWPSSGQLAPHGKEIGNMCKRALVDTVDHWQKCIRHPRLNMEAALLVAKLTTVA